MADTKLSLKPFDPTEMEKISASAVADALKEGRAAGGGTLEAVLVIGVFGSVVRPGMYVARGRYLNAENMAAPALTLMLQDVILPLVQDVTLAAALPKGEA